MSHEGFIPGDSWNICDRCGVKVRQSQTAVEWTGLKVCRDGCWDPRHPQDFVRGVPDHQAVRNPRPEPTNYPLRMDLERIRIDDETTLIDEQGDYYLDTNEVTKDSL